MFCETGGMAAFQTSSPLASPFPPSLSNPCSASPPRCRGAGWPPGGPPGPPPGGPPGPPPEAAGPDPAAAEGGAGQRLQPRGGLLLHGLRESPEHHPSKHRTPPLKPLNTTPQTTEHHPSNHTPPLKPLNTTRGLGESPGVRAGNVGRVSSHTYIFACFNI